MGGLFLQSYGRSGSKQKSGHSPLFNQSLFTRGPPSSWVELFRSSEAQD